MAFGFFKKKETADIIYMNGHIYTQDPAFPWATAVACKGDNIMAVGDFDGMEEITDADTEVYDLQGKYMFPGFIDAHGTPVLKAFADKYLPISSEWDVEPILDLLADYVDECDQPCIFGYGYNEKFLERYETPEEAHAVLDEIERDRPVLLLGISGVHCWMNSVAAALVETAADDDGVQYITTEYILQILNPLDFEEMEQAVLAYSEQLTDRGITSVFNLCAPDYFTNLYIDALLAAIGESEGTIQQRLLSSLYINRPFNPQFILHRLAAAKTNCIELNRLITADFMKIDLSAEDGPSVFSQEALDTICLAVAEKGFHLHLDGRDATATAMAAETFGLLRSKGCKSNTLVLASSHHDEADGEAPWLSTWPTGGDASVFDDVHTVEEAIDALTIEAAELTGMSKVLGSIEKDKRADFTVFEENPFDTTLSRFASMHAELTILDGQVVYDAEEAAADELCDMLFQMQM